MIDFTYVNNVVFFFGINVFWRYFVQLGVVLLEQGKASQALAYLDKALELEPEHEQALLNSAILLQELGAADLRHLARQRLLKLLDKDGMLHSITQCSSIDVTIGILNNESEKFDTDSWLQKDRVAPLESYVN